MRKCIKCGYFGVGMLLALIVSDMMGLLEFGTIVVLLIAAAGGGLGYLFALVLLSLIPDETDESRFGRGRTSGIASPFAPYHVKQ